MEETTNQQVFSDFKFITHEELVSLDSVHLLQSGKIQPHMHGYLIPYKLYTFIQSKIFLYCKNNPVVCYVWRNKNFVLF